MGGRAEMKKVTAVILSVIMLCGLFHNKPTTKHAWIWANIGVLSQLIKLR